MSSGFSQPKRTPVVSAVFGNLAMEKIMKTLCTVVIACLFSECYSQTIDSNYLEKALVLKSDSTISLTANIRLDYRIFGYSKPDTSSGKMILFSIFTSDVKGNPYKCPLGSYYQTPGREVMIIKSVGKNGEFVKAKILRRDSADVTVYFLKQWIEFEE